MSEFFKTLSWFSSDMIFLIVAFVIFFFCTIYFGKNRTISLILAYFPAVALYKALPFLDKLLVLKGDKMLVLNKVGVFLIILIPLMIIINRYIFAEMEIGKMHLIRVAGLALVCVVLTLLFSYTVVDFTTFHDFAGSIDTLFATPTKIFIANLIPLALLAFL